MTLPAALLVLTQAVFFYAAIGQVTIFGYKRP